MHGRRSGREVTTTWTAEGLRRASLDALGVHAEGRARDALARGVLSIEPAVAAWEASEGRMHAHRVHLLLDATRLGEIRAAPVVEDALRAAIAAAIATHRAETLDDLVLGWAPPPDERPYRDGPPRAVSPSDGLGRALVDYLVGATEVALARFVVAGEIAISSGDATAVSFHLSLAPADFDAVESDERSRRVLGRALRDLSGEPNARVVVHRLRTSPRA